MKEAKVGGCSGVRRRVSVKLGLRGQLMRERENGKGDRGRRGEGCTGIFVWFLDGIVLRARWGLWSPWWAIVSCVVSCEQQFGAEAFDRQISICLIGIPALTRIRSALNMRSLPYAEDPLSAGFNFNAKITV